MFLQQLVNGISVGGVYALIASGYALIYSLLGFSNWAHGEVAMLGAYVALLFTASLQLPFVLAAVIGIGGAAVISFLNERLAYRRIRENKAPTMFLMIAAMGLSIVFQNGSMLLFGCKIPEVSAGTACFFHSYRQCSCRRIGPAYAYCSGSSSDCT